MGFGALVSGKAVKYVDPDGRSLAGTFSWLAVIDGPLPIGDFIVIGLGIVDLLMLAKVVDNYSDAPNFEEQTEDPVSEILEDAVPGRETKGRSKQYDKSGGFDEANDNFDKLNLDDVRENEKGRTLWKVQVCSHFWIRKFKSLFQIIILSL